jgi:hypothetical protein
MKCQISQAFTKPRPQFIPRLGSVRSLRRAVRCFQFETQRRGFAHGLVGHAAGAALADTVRASSLTGPELGPDVLTKTLLCVLPGYLLQVAIRGADAVAAIPEAVRELFPAAR